MTSITFLRVHLMPHRILARRLALLALLAVGCSRPPAPETSTFDLEAARAVIAEQSRQFTEAHVRQDTAAIDSMFLPDARSHPPGAPSTVGIAAIHAGTVALFQFGLTEFRQESAALYGNAEYMIDEGTYVMTFGPRHSERGKYLTVWRQVDGRWRIQANIWNAGPPDAAAK